MRSTVSQPMDDETARALQQLNGAFYRDCAASFSRTRTRPWRGWERWLRWLPARPGGAALRVLDVGCGNARLARFLAEKPCAIDYTGLDASEPMLALARDRLPEGGAARLQLVDFVATAPEQALPDASFDLVALFGVLHGIPGRERRLALVRAAARRLSPGGLLALTTWRFDGAALRHRIVPWEAPAARALGIDPSRLEPGDHLVAWGDERQLRYAHAIDAAELDALAADTGLVPLARYRDDGRDGAANEYALFRRG